MTLLVGIIFIVIIFGISIYINKEQNNITKNDKFINKDNKIEWLSISNFTLEINEPYLSFIKYFPILLSNINWNIKHGDYVKAGDILFIAKSKMITSNDLIFKSPKDGYIIFNTQKFWNMTINYKEKFIGISNNKPINTPKKSIASGGGYYNDEYILSLIHNNKLYVRVPIVGNRCVNYYIHPDLKINQHLIHIIKWLNDNDRNFYNIIDDENNRISPYIFINKDYTIDIKSDVSSIQVRDSGKLPNFIKFNNIEGNFKIDFYPININVIPSLIGCPQKVTGNFECDRNSLISFNGAPKYVGGDFIANTNKISSFIGMPNYIGGYFNIANNEFTDASWEYAKENINSEFGNYNIANNKFIKYLIKLY